MIEQEGLIVIGKPLDNPYSLKNMQFAFERIKTKKENEQIIPSDFELEATDYYVRFLPKDSSEYNTLSEELQLELFDFPLDHEVLGDGFYYHDPSIPEGEITWLYTTVPTDFIFPDIEYELLEECFIPDDDTDEEKSDFFSQLEITAFQITGNHDDIQDDLTKGKPNGTIKVRNTTTSSYEGVKKIKIRVHNFVKWRTTYTNENGYYSFGTNFRTKVRYAVIYRNQTGFKIWGNWAFLNPACYYLGKHSSSGYSKNINVSVKAWLWSTVNNAAYIYREEICPYFGISKPPSSLRFWTFRTSGNLGSGSAPMARQISMSSSTLNDLLIGYGITWLTSYIALCSPDIFILKDFTNTYETYGTVFHELAHASHYTKVGKWYWLKFVTGVIGNGSDNPYGDGTGNKDGYIGVGEMWGYYFGYAAMKREFGYAGFGGINYWFKPQIIREIVANPHFANQKIFSCLTSDVNRHYKLKNKIISNYGQSTFVNQVFSDYGF